jgi:hypothetical protein
MWGGKQGTPLHGNHQEKMPDNRMKIEIERRADGEEEEKSGWKSFDERRLLFALDCARRPGGLKSFDSSQCNGDAMRYISPPVFCHNSTLG